MTTSLDSIELVHASRRPRFARPALERPAWPASTPERVEREVPPPPPAPALKQVRRPTPSSDWMDAPTWPAGTPPVATPRTAPVQVPEVPVPELPVPEVPVPEVRVAERPVLVPADLSAPPPSPPPAPVRIEVEASPAPAVPRVLAVAAISPRLEQEESVEPPPERAWGPAELEMDPISAEWFVEGTLDPFFDGKPVGPMPWWALAIPATAAALTIGLAVALLAAASAAGF